MSCRGRVLLTAVLCFTCAPAACSSSDADDADAGACAGEKQRITEFLADNRDCTDDYECGKAPAMCAFGFEDACCTVYLAKSHDAARWQTLRDELHACQGGGPCGCCFGLVPEPACIQGKCRPGQIKSSDGGAP